MNSTPDQYMERRSGNDRRNWHCEYDYPYVDGHGMLVINDRRKGNERRDLVFVANAIPVVS